MEEQYTLGDLITELEKHKSDDIIRFDFGDCVPLDFDSWRGSYCELSLCFGDENAGDITVKDLLDRCNKANGKTYEGYKGGYFRMDKETPIWIANYSRASNTVITGIHDTGYGYLYINTAYKEY